VSQKAGRATPLAFSGVWEKYFTPPSTRPSPQGEGEIFAARLKIRTHIGVAFQLQSFIPVGFFSPEFFGGQILIAINPLFHNGFVHPIHKFEGLASQLQKHFQTAAIFICPGATRKYP
jgi:hypothetical protein